MGTDRGKRGDGDLSLQGRMMRVGIRDLGNIEMGGLGEVGVRVRPRRHQRRGGEGADLAFVSSVRSIKGSTGEGLIEVFLGILVGLTILLLIILIPVGVLVVGKKKGSASHGIEKGLGNGQKGGSISDIDASSIPVCFFPGRVCFRDAD